MSYPVIGFVPAVTATTLLAGSGMVDPLVLTQI
jgi:hypothetical protein